MYSLKRFRCYLEGSTFEVLTENQVLRNFLTKKNFSRRETRWLDLFADFNLHRITSVQGRAHVLGVALSRAPPQPSLPNSHTVDSNVNNIQITTASLENFIKGSYDNDQFFAPIFQALHGNFPKDTVQADKLKYILPSFSYKDGILYYNTQVCVPRTAVKKLLQLAHDSSLGGHFSFS